MTDKSAHIHCDPGMRLVARTGSGHDIVMDDREGDSGSRPTELVLAGLGGCTAMDVRSILRKKQQDVSRLDVYVGATQRAEYPQIFSDIDLLVEVEGPGVRVAAVCHAIELAARKSCSVSAMLAAGETVVHHRYRVIGTGAEPFDETGEVGASGPFARPEAL